MFFGEVQISFAEFDFGEAATGFVLDVAEAAGLGKGDRTVEPDSGGAGVALAESEFTDVFVEEATVTDEAVGTGDAEGGG